MRRVYLAIDAHARPSVLGCMDARGNFERSWRFKTTEAELIRHVEGVGEAKKLLSIEEGPLAFWMAQTLTPYVTELVIADPHENKLISRRANKGDKVDVRSLCRLLRLGELKHVYHPSEDERAVFKAAVQQYLSIRDQAVKLQSQIKAKYRAWGVLDVVGTDRVYSEEGRKEFLAKLTVRPVRNQLSRLYVLLDTTRRVGITPSPIPRHSEIAAAVSRGGR